MRDKRKGDEGKMEERIIKKGEKVLGGMEKIEKRIEKGLIRISDN